MDENGLTSGLTSGSVDREKLIETVKLLALEHGSTKAARIAGVNVNTVKAWSRRYNWKLPRTQPKLHPAQLTTTQPAEILRSQLLNNKSRSTLALSSYLATTSEKLDQSPDATKIGLSRRAKDLGDLHGRLYPPETGTQNILNIAVLTGQRTIRRIASADAPGAADPDP